MITRIRLSLRRYRRVPGVRSGENGFAAVDAMVALVILSTTIILSLGAVEIGRKASVKALETRKAGALLQGLLETSPGQIGALSGTANGFDWRVVTTPAKENAATNPTKLCDRVAQALSRASGRRYVFTTTDVCALEARP